MGDLRTKLLVAPLPIVFVVMAVMFGTAMYFVPRPEGEALPVGGAVMAGVLWASMRCVGVVIARRRDVRAGGDRVTSERLTLERSLKHGELPEDPTLDPALLALIERRQRQARWSARAGPWVFGAFTVLSVVLAVTGEPSQWIYAVLFVGLLVWTRVLAKRQTERYDRLEAACHARGSSIR